MSPNSQKKYSCYICLTTDTKIVRYENKCYSLFICKVLRLLLGMDKLELGGKFYPKNILILALFERQFWYDS